MKFNQKRTYNGCKAIYLSGDLNTPICRLGHPVSYDSLKPLEPCSKPTSYEELSDLYEKKVMRKENSIS